ncbi:MAG: hypothetical protein WBA77_17520 [Microcoleaceae cyanobacterium]
MNIHPNFRVSWLLFAVPFISTLGISTASSQAATFASSTTLVNLTNFSANAESSLVSVDAAALAISPVGSTIDLDTLDDVSAEESIAAEAANGDVVATADFNTVAFFPSDTSGNNSSFVSSEIDNEALGVGGDYLAKSNTESTVLANFFLNPDAGESETFSFDFNVFWGLETFASQATEFSSATADVSLSVCGRTSLDENPLFCDSLSTFGSLDNSGTTTAFAFQNSDPFSIDVLSNPMISGDTNFQQADFFALGSYQREFDTPIYLTLTEVQRSEAIVSTPEPSTTIAFFSFSAVIMALKKKKK